MQDICMVQRYSAFEDAYGNPSPDYTDQPAISCGVDQSSPTELQGSGRVPEIDLSLRLPVGTVIDPRDRIKVTHRYGLALATAEVYAIVGPVERGPSGLVVRLKRHKGI